MSSISLSRRGKQRLPQDVYEAFEGVRTPLEVFYGVLDVLEGRLAGVMQPFIDSINNHLAPALQTVKERIDGVKTSIEEILEPYLTPMRDKFQAISDKLKPIVGFLKDAEGLMYAFGAAIYSLLYFRSQAQSGYCSNWGSSPSSSSI